MLTKRIEGEFDINRNSFDMIRIFCTYIVFFGHFLTHFEVDSPVSFFIAYFVRAVPVFFLFSGFFTAASLEKYNTKEFYIRRIFRIYPAMWVCIIINTIIIVVSYSFFPSFKDFMVYVGSQFTIGQFYTADWLRGYGVGAPNGALWTISPDIQFYVLAVFLARIMKNRSLKTWVFTVLGFAAGSLILGQMQSHIPDTIYKLLMVVIVPFMYIFLFGMMVYYHKEKIIPFLANHWIVIALLYTGWSLLPTSITKYFDGVRYNVMTTLLLMCLVVAVGFAFGQHRVKVDYTYGFYLYHMVVINVIYHIFMKRFDSQWILLVVLIISSVVIFGLAYVSTKWVDQKVSKNLQARAFDRFLKTPKMSK